MMQRFGFWVGGLVLLVGLAPVASTQEKGGQKVSGALQFEMTSLDGKKVDLSKYQGKVVLFVNVASKCGYTPQYKDLQEIHEKLGKDGLAIVGVPSNDFGRQEPGSNADIAEFCKANYGVTFDMMGKVVVKGEGQCPLYKFLTSKDTNPKFAGPIRWNFEKFLVNRNGEVVARYASDASFEDIRKAIRRELDQK
jgi:glutathione peroxidase